MNAEVRLAQDCEKSVIQNLDQLYIYEFSRMMPERYALSSDGLFHDDDYEKYWREPDCYPYLVFADSELAGFALVQQKETGSNLDQFFIVAKFQGSGIAQQAAIQLFETYKGLWSVQSFLGNEKSEKFWKRTIAMYSRNSFEVALQEPNRTHHEYRFRAG